MATAVFFHAHPDDEAIATGGTMLRGASLGHRIVLVCATDGAVGEADPDIIPEGETLADVRAREQAAACNALGVDRMEFLGYRDSGMAGTEDNEHPDCLAQADIDEAAEKLAAILRQEQADLITFYDPIGGYHHPDHIAVHHVGKRAADLAGVPHRFESTMHRENMAAFASSPEWVESAIADGSKTREEALAEQAQFANMDLGTPAAEITHAVDISEFLTQKKLAMIAHASQISEDSVFLTLEDEAFATAFGFEHFVHHGAERSGEPYLDDIYAVLEE